MPRRGNPFQSLVRDLHDGATDGAVVRESVELADQVTGQLREVDVLIELDVGGYPILVAVECTATSRPADVTWVEQMVQKHADLPTNKLVLVSASGFSDGAIAKAVAKNASTLRLEELGEQPWTKVVGKQESLLLEWVRASVGITIATDPDEEWPGTRLSLAESLVRGNTTVQVARLIDAVLDKPELLEVALQVSGGSEGHGCTIDFRAAPGIHAVRCDGTSVPVARLLAVFLPSVNRDRIELRSGIVGETAVAFGGVRDTDGREVDVSVIEVPDGKIRATWTERHPGTAPQSGSLFGPPVLDLDPAPSADIKALMGKERE